MGITRIVISGDILRPAADCPSLSESVPRIKWLEDLLTPALMEVTDLPIGRLACEGPLRLDDLYADGGHTPSIEAWAEMYAGALPAALTERLASLYRDALVISHELPPSIALALRNAGIPFIDCIADPHRFLNDVPLSWRSSSPQVINAIEPFRLTAFEIRRRVAQIRAKSRWLADLEVPEGATLVLDQMPTDAAMIDPRRRRHVNWTDYREQLRALAAEGPIIWRPHPNRQNADQITEIMGATTRVDANLYRLLSHDRLARVVAISSGGVVEARAFGKDGRHLLDRFAAIELDGWGAPVPVVGDWLSPHFWSAVLAPLVPTKANVPTISPEKDFFRRSINCDWGFNGIDRVIVREHGESREDELERYQRERELEQRNVELERRTRVIESRNAALEVWAHELEGRNAGLEQRAHELDTRNIALERRGQELERQQRESDRRTRALEDRNVQLEQHAASLGGRNLELEERAAHLEGRSAELEPRMAALERRNTDLEAHAQDVEGRNTDLEQRARELDSRNADLDARNTDLEQRAGDLEARNTDLEIHASTLEARNADLEHRTLELSARNSDLEQRAHELEARTLLLETHNTDLDRRRHDLEARVVMLDSRVQQLEQHLGELVPQHLLEQRCSDLERQSAEALAQLDTVSARAMALEGQLRRVSSADRVRVQQLMDAFVQEANAAQLRVGVLGAGAHTQYLFETTNLEHVPNLFLFDNDPRSWGRELNGRHVRPPQDIVSLSLDAVVVSSLAFENEMVAQLEALNLPDLRVVRCYPGVN